MVAEVEDEAGVAVAVVVEAEVEEASLLPTLPLWVAAVGKRTLMFVER